MKSLAQKRTENVTREKTVNRTAKTERPSRAKSRAGGRPMRNARSIADFRDILGVLNKDPEWRYRWVLSTAEMDKSVFDAMRAGWEFADATKEIDLVIGEYAVNKTEKWGSHYRIPAARRSKDEYLYLMRMPEEFALEVDAYKAEKVDAAEKDIMRTKKVDDSDDQETGGQYSDKGNKVWEEDRVYQPGKAGG
jgi:hypothetical protein